MLHRAGADPGFFLGGGALVSCSTSTPINHIFFGRIPVVLENCRSSQGGRGVHTPCTLPLDPPLSRACGIKQNLCSLLISMNDIDIIHKKFH